MEYAGARSSLNEKQWIKESKNRPFYILYKLSKKLLKSLQSMAIFAGTPSSPDKKIQNGMSENDSSHSKKSNEDNHETPKPH